MTFKKSNRRRFLKRGLAKESSDSRRTFRLAARRTLALSLRKMTHYYLLLPGETRSVSVFRMDLKSRPRHPSCGPERCRNTENGKIISIES